MSINKTKQDRQCTYNVTPMRFYETILAMEKQLELHISVCTRARARACVCVCSCGTRARQCACARVALLTQDAKRHHIHICGLDISNTLIDIIY
jgi:hypothetical protein